MYEIAICDDEPAICDMVSNVIREWGPDIKISCFYSGESLLASYESFDVIFLDIDMKGIDGIETGRQIRERDMRPGLFILPLIVTMWPELLKCMHSNIC